MNFADASKKRINPSAKRNDRKIWVKFSKFFWTTGILKELVITVSNKSISINTPFHFETIWIRDFGAPRGTIFEKNQMNLLITPAQAIGHEIPDLEISSPIIWKTGNKNDEFLKETDN